MKADVLFLLKAKWVPVLNLVLSTALRKEY